MTDLARDTSAETVEWLAKSLAFVVHGTGMGIEMRKSIADRAAAALRALLAEREARHVASTTKPDDIDPIDAGVPPDLLAERNAAEAVLEASNKRVRAARLVALTEEPKCPECGAGVMRPKCFYEMGGDCPRHDVVAAYGEVSAIRAQLAKKGS